jgi:hypothetical protein
MTSALNTGAARFEVHSLATPALISNGFEIPGRNIVSHHKKTADLGLFENAQLLLT